MPSKYPICKPSEVCAVLKKCGFQLVKQTGSHAKYTNGLNIVIVPMHCKDLKVGTLKSIIEQSGLSIDEFIKHL